MSNLQLEKEILSHRSILGLNDPKSHNENTIKSETYTLISQIEYTNNDLKIKNLDINSNNKTEEVDNNINNSKYNTIFNIERMKFDMQIDKSEKNFKNKKHIRIIETQLKKKDELNLKKKEFICHFQNCYKKYKSKENLNLHIKNIHYNIKPYLCRFCSACFSHRNGIKLY